MSVALQQSVSVAAGLGEITEALQTNASGYMGLRLLRDSDKNGTHAKSLTATATLKSRAKYGQNSLKVQVRPVLMRTRHSGNNKFSTTVDESYWERQLSAVSFVFLGRKKIVNGVAVGRNPSNFFEQNKFQDRTLNDEDRRAETVGDDMLGWSYFGRSYSIHSVVALPSHDSKRMRALLQLSGNLESFTADILAYYAEHSALGANLSTVLGENSVLYVEAAIRKGRDRPTPILSYDNVVMGLKTDNHRWISDIAIGGQFTLGNGIGVTAEYWRNNHGFSGRESAGIVKSLSFGQGNLRLAGALLGAKDLRRNSIFFRIANIPLPDTANGEFGWIHNLDDNSSFLRGSINWDISAADNLRIGVDWFVGAKFSEYGSSKVNRRIFLNYKKHF